MKMLKLHTYPISITLRFPENLGHLYDGHSTFLEMSLDLVHQL